MNNSKRTEHYTGNVAVMAAGILTSAFGLLAMIGWILHLPMIASFSVDYIPMAPSTALFFILIGTALALRSRLPHNRGTYFASLSIGLLVAVPGTIFFISSLGQKYMPIEKLGFSITETLNGIPIGHMSPVTAVGFAACALVFLLTLSKTIERSRRAWITLVLALILVLTWLLFLFAYLLQTPMMYSGDVIPPALPTSLAFLFLAVGLLISAVVQSGHYIKIKSASGKKEVPYVFLLIFIFLTAGILTGGYLAFQGFEKNFREEVEEQLSAVSELKVTQLSRWRKERLGDANIFYKNYSFSELVKRYSKNPLDADAKKRIQTWIKQVAESYNYNRICLHNMAGTELISFPQKHIHATDLFSDLSAKVKETGKVEFQDFYIDEDDKKVYISVFLPILDEYDNKNPIGVAILRIDPYEYLYPLIEKWPIPSKTAETLIIRRDGNQVLFLNNIRFKKNAALNLRIPLTNESLPAVKAISGKTGIVEGIDYRGVPVIAAVRAVPDSPWFIVARMDLDEIYEPLSERFWMIIIFVGTLIIGTGWGVFLVWRQENNRFYREQYKSAEALKLNKRMLNEAERLGKVGGWEFDIDTKELIWSEEVCRIHEVDVNFQPTIEKGINFYAPASRPVIERAVQRSIVQSEPFDVELEIITAKNNLRWVHAIGNVDQERRKVFGFFQDITERKQAEDKALESQDELKKALEISNQSRQTLLSVLEDHQIVEKEIQKLNKELEQRVIDRTAQLEASNKELEAFSYSVSHDLRAPLRHINGYVDMLNKKYYETFDEKARYYLDTITDSSKRMGILIDDLLQFSRTGRKELSNSEIDLNVLIREVLKELEHIIVERKIKWDIQDLPQVFGDYALLKLVWTNLIDNAIKYTRNQTSAKISIKFKIEAKNYIFCIQDNGTGFDMKYAHKLFGVFQRLHSQAEFEGTGIGLANVQRIINKHAGKVWAEAKLNKGASFYFTLPIKTE
ncbi:MAG: GHKL domain-containing protein [Melioribacteraceae bacterium]|nr:GHKL domain-containing protein [Melioribacteraceae bacterium]MCF8396166.1 GHKL domain-containing protein [Melioribacteraceae bacterium]MCF8421224.1 GHKL domain-containing protein [Melioribacteraceae bacterium]